MSTSTDTSGPAPSSPSRLRPSRRWAVPAVVTVTLVGGALVVPQLASADPELPPTTAADLLVDLATAPEQPFSGTVVQTSDLGLPELPTGGQASTLTTLLAGSTTLRVWSDGPERSRVALLGSLSETDVIRNGTDVWAWESEGNTATHVTVPEGADSSAGTGVPSAPTPEEAAAQALAALDPTTAVTLDGTATVAGRDAYQLVLEPRDADSLVGEVRLAVDAATSLPLSVQVTARGASSPAYETAFTSVSFDRPGDEVFAFTPPPGAEVTDRSAPGGRGSGEGGHRGRPGGGGGPGGHRGDLAGAAPTVVGEGWTSVVVLQGVDAAQVTGAVGGEGVGSALLAGFQPVSGDFGTGRVLSTSLVSVLWLDDGRVLVGSVTPAVLEAAASDPAAAVVP